MDFGDDISLPFPSDLAAKFVEKHPRDAALARRRDHAYVTWFNRWVWPVVFWGEVDPDPFRWTYCRPELPVRSSHAVPPAIGCDAIPVRIAQHGCNRKLDHPERGAAYPMSNDVDWIPFPPPPPKLQEEKHCVSS